VGDVTSGAYAFTSSGAAGLCKIEADRPIDEAYVSGGKWEVNLAGKTYPAVVSLELLYDPEMERIKA
jgi:glycine cleavage system aminomethyltransferase T